jgi:hypothetical protein
MNNCNRYDFTGECGPATGCDGFALGGVYAVCPDKLRVELQLQLPESYEMSESGGFALGWGIGHTEEKIGSYLAAYTKQAVTSRWDWQSMSLSAPVSVAQVAADPRKAFS